MKVIVVALVVILINKNISSDNGAPPIHAYCLTTCARYKFSYYYYY